MLKRTLVFLFLAGFGYCAVAQETDVSEIDTQAAKALKDSTRAQRKAWNKENTIFKPIIGLGAGVFNYIGEVDNNGNTNPLINNYGFQASVIKNFSPSFGLKFDVAYGKMSARERSVAESRNFSTDVVNFNLHATYNFAGILRAGRFLSPYISVGVGAVNFNTKGDLRDENGIAYNYWSDGTIRSLAQATDGSAQPDAQILRADYVYETDLRKANLDSLGNYKQFAVTLPFTFGLHFKVSPRSSIQLSTTFSYAFTDLIDNYTKDGIESRKGNKANDMFFFTGVSYHFDFFSPKKVKTSQFDNTEFESLDGDDDGDGVPNLTDRCPNTPAGSGMVDELGCSLDTDGDGVFDYADEEPNTDSNLNVDAKGVGITDDSFNELPDSIATLRAQMFEVYPDMREIYGMSKDDNLSIEEFKGEFNGASSPYSLVDTNKDGSISVSEVYNAIDLFFEGELQVNAKYITDLIDYFFDQ
jgi:hypothetical protein